MAALWLILKELTRRLKGYWSQPSRRDGEELLLGVASSFPTHELFFEIDAHFIRVFTGPRGSDEISSFITGETLLKTLLVISVALENSHVQRRLLTKFKDKTPTPLANLDSLLEGTYKQIQVTDVISENFKGMEEDGCQLSCVVRLVLEMTRLATGMSDQEFALLSGAMSPVVHPSMEQVRVFGGWLWWY
ncbi:Protein PTHB1 [Portunus trituberculatus]|uniref:Protein PTHB1 n=1 Tax=Portunus trituberculatus TaxID=210409 RepID=A0A5B7F326_PORTR|nr:Protein PTHB1 [Portunus trituberculatus]